MQISEVISDPVLEEKNHKALRVLTLTIVRRYKIKLAKWDLVYASDEKPTYWEIEAVTARYVEHLSRKMIR